MCSIFCYFHCGWLYHGFTKSGESDRKIILLKLTPVLLPRGNNDANATALKSRKFVHSLKLGYLRFVIYTKRNQTRTFSLLVDRKLLQNPFPFRSNLAWGLEIKFNEKFHKRNEFFFSLLSRRRRLHFLRGGFLPGVVFIITAVEILSRILENLKICSLGKAFSKSCVNEKIYIYVFDSFYLRIGKFRDILNNSSRLTV